MINNTSFEDSKGSAEGFGCVIDYHDRDEFRKGLPPFPEKETKVQKMFDRLLGVIEILSGRAGTGPRERLSEHGLTTDPPLFFRLGYDELLVGKGISIVTTSIF